MITLKINMRTNKNYYSQTLIVSCMKLKLKMSMKILVALNKCLISVIRLTQYYDNSNRLVIGKIKDKTRGVMIDKFVGQKPKIYSFLVDKIEHKKSKNCESKCC